MFKKAILFTVLLLSAVGYAYAATTLLEVSYKKDVSLDKTEVLYEYNAGIDVAVSETGRFKIPVPAAVGSLIGVAWKSASTDCTVWGATSDDLASDDTQVVFRLDNASGGYSPAIPERPFRNRSAEEEDFLFVAVQNDDAANAIADGKLSLIFRK